MNRNNSRRKQRLALLTILVIILIVFIPILRKKPDPKPTAVTKASTVRELIETTPTRPESVCLDPGHGGKDVGAIYKSITESELNMIVAEEVALRLVDAGYKVYFTRTDDSFVYKRDRARYCNSVKADILVAIHHNSYMTDHLVNYASTLYYKDIDKKLASSLQNSISSGLEIKNQGISKFDNSELWIAEMPAALTEAFFITNTTEYKSLVKDNSRLVDEAKAISEGTINYFINPDSITEPTTVDSLIIDRVDLGE